jgi:hypothetical protein
VPDDEADEIRALFDDHEVPFYETSPSRWGISMGGFWIHDDAEAERGRELLQTYQQERLQRQRQAYEQDLAEGRTGGFWHRFRHKPMTTLAAGFAILVILALTLAPYITL